MSYTTIVKVKKLADDARLPGYAYEDDAGIDIYSNEDKCIPANGYVAISTGISIELQSGHVALVWDKSGLAFNSGLKTMAGVIDSGYRGEVKIILYNTTKVDYNVKKHQKIAQILIQKIEHALLLEDTSLNNTKRGESGFGSTGLI